jgi:glycerol-3-phosphate dehydrogenase
LKDVAVIDDLGIDFGNGLYQVEVEYLVQNEWACTAEDILFRRTKLGITMPQVKVKNLERYLQGSAKICTANTTGTKPLLSDQAEVRRSV